MSQQHHQSFDSSAIPLLDGFGREMRSASIPRKRRDDPSPSHSSGRDGGVGGSGHPQRRGRGDYFRDDDSYDQDYSYKRNASRDHHPDRHHPYDRRRGTGDYASDRRRPPPPPHHHRPSIPTHLDPERSELLLTPLQYIEYRRLMGLHRPGPDGAAETERLYDGYKASFTKKHLEKFFSTYKSSAWFLERYSSPGSLPDGEGAPDTSKVESSSMDLVTDGSLCKSMPTYFTRVMERRVDNRTFFEELLASGKLDGVSFDDQLYTPSTDVPMVNASTEEDIPVVESSESVTAMEEDSVPTDKSAHTATRQFPEPFVSVEKETTFLKPYARLFIKNLPFEVSYNTLKDFIQSHNLLGFKYIALSEPKVDRSMSRFGWIVFEAGTNLDQAIASLNEKTIQENATLHVIPEFPAMTKQVKFTPWEMGTPERISADLALIKSLTFVMDRECGLSGTADLIAEKLSSSDGNASLDEKKALDMYMIYLEIVHNYNYYQGVESLSPEEHFRRTADFRRKPKPAHLDDPIPRRDWTDRVDLRVRQRIHSSFDYDLAAMPEGWEELDLAAAVVGYKDVQKELDLIATGKIKQETEAKFRCLECTKLFKGEDFVRKHLYVKHPELFTAVREELTLYNRYVLDPNHLDGSRAAIAEREQRDREAQRESYRSGGYQSRRDSYGGMDGYSSNRRDSGGAMRGGPAYPVLHKKPPPPPSGRVDPRQVKSYRDLDAPAMEDVEINYD